MSATSVGPPRGIVRAPVGPGEHRRLAPPTELADYVAHFWWVAWDLPEPAVTETLPHPTAHLVFEGARAELRGVPTRRFVRRLEGRGRVFGIKLRPAALAPLWSGSVSALRDRGVPLARVFGPGARRWAERVLRARTLEAAMALAEPVLRARLPPMPPEIAAVRDLVETMERDRSLTRVEQVAERMGVSVRTLERAFRAYVGVSPKWVLERYRLHEAAARLRAPHPPTLARLATELGYFDQAHFARAFKAAVGVPPRALRG